MTLRINRGKIDLDLSEKQTEALQADEPVLLYGGAKGGGKSWFLCIWIFLEAIKHPGNRLFFFRKRAVDFLNTTLQTWKKVVPSNLYRINENKRVITIPKANSEIFFGGLDDEIIVEKLNSFESGGGAIDQAEEITKDAFAMCRGTLRHTLFTGKLPSYNIRMSANPAQCWLKDDFLLSPREGYRYIRALPTDNPNLPQGYIQTMIASYEHRPELLKAYVHGSWDGLSSHNSCVTMDWIDKAKQKQPYGVVSKRVIVNDPALFGDDENVVMVMEQSENIRYMKHMLVLPKQGPMETAGLLAIERRKWNATDIYVDQTGVGEGVVDKLNELNEPVTGVVSAQRPTIETEHKKYSRLKDQIWMEAGELFAQGRVALGKDPLLTGQLSSITFRIINGRYKVDTKDEIKKKLGRSPDRGDCFVVGLYGLQDAKSILDKEYEESGTDRAGHGRLVEVEQNEYTVFPDTYIEELR